MRQEDTPTEVLAFRVSNFNILVAFLGGFLSLFGLVSYLLKEKFYLSEACASGLHEAMRPCTLTFFK